MKISKVIQNKKQYLDLLLLADEQEDMIDRYLERGEMFVLDDDGVKAECVVTPETSCISVDDSSKDSGIYELKNIAVDAKYHRKGYGKKLVKYVFDYYKNLGAKTLYVGTGDCPSSLGFYHSCGFIDSHRVKNFFTDNYDHEIFECGVKLVDMVYLKKEF